MSSWIDGQEILFNFDEEIVYVSIGCSVDSLDSLDQQLPCGLRKFFNSSEKHAKLWLFDPKFWNVMPLALRSPAAIQTPRLSAKEMILDLNENFTQEARNVYRQGSLEIEVCPVYFERRAKFFDSFFSYLQLTLAKGGHVYLSIFTQPYLRVEENEDVVGMYNSLVDKLAETDISAFSRLHYHHLAEYGTALEDGQTLVWSLKEGVKHDQDEALIREVARFQGETPTFGCGCYAAYPGSFFAVSKNEYGNDYSRLHQRVLQVIEERGGRDKVLQFDEIKLNHIVFP